jgi:disulfide bond formation protein DsbB
VEAQLALGAAHYQGTCGVCHGRDASGLRGLGSPLVGSEFVRTRSESELVGFLVAGRGRQDVGNTTGLPMPARGGNPGLSDDDLTAIVRYLRYLDGQYLEGQHLDGQHLDGRPVQLARR